MTTLTTDDLISEITDEVSGLPYAQRMAVVRAYEQILELFNMKTKLPSSDTLGPSTPATPSYHPKATGTPGSFSPDAASARHAPVPSGSALKWSPRQPTE